MTTTTPILYVATDLADGETLRAYRARTAPVRHARRAPRIRLSRARRTRKVPS